MSETLNLLKQLFYGLDEQEQERFLSELKADKVLKTLPPKEVHDCPYCHSTHFVKNGKKEGKQRYLCRDCRRSFMERTGSILFHSRKGIEVWETYIECMLEKCTLEECARACKIQISTAFVWRHKICDALRNMMEQVRLNGVVEADETFFKLSFKGNGRHFQEQLKAGIEPNKLQRGLSTGLVCVPVGVNLDGLSIAKAAKLGATSIKSLCYVLQDRIIENSILVTDKHKGYDPLAAAMNLAHIKVDKDTNCNGAFNIQKVNNYHQQIKLMMKAFRGVSTKYLNNYLVYHNFANIAKDKFENKVVILLDFIRNTPCVSHFRTISHRPKIPIPDL